MNVRFVDLEDQHNPLSGTDLTSASDVIGLLDVLRASRSPFMCDLIGENGFKLTVGLVLPFQKLL